MSDRVTVLDLRTWAESAKSLGRPDDAEALARAADTLERLQRAVMKAAQDRCADLEGAMRTAPALEAKQAARIAALESALKRILEWNDGSLPLGDESWLEMVEIARQALATGNEEGTRSSSETAWQPGIECEHGYDACPICDA